MQPVERVEPAPPTVYRFGEFEVDLRAQLLRRSGEPVTLTKKSFDTLVHLVRNRGRLVPREELIAAVWPDVVVEEGNLHWTISAVRKALANGSAGESCITTVRGQGYRFVPEVREEVASPSAGLTLSPVSPLAAPAYRSRSRRLVAFGLAAAAFAVFLLFRPPAPVVDAHPPASLPVGASARVAYATGLAALKEMDGLEAKRNFSACVKAEPAFAPGHTALSRALSLLGEEPESAAEALRGDALAASLPLAERRLAEGHLRRKTKRWKEALAVYRWLRATYPRDLEIGLQLAQTQMEAGRAKEALVTAEALRALPAPFGDDPRVDLMEGNAAQRMADFRRQLASCQRAAARARARNLPLVHLKATQRIATAWLDLAHLPEARAASDESVRLARASGVPMLLSDALYTRGALLRNEGDFQGAREALSECASLDESRGDRAAQYRAVRQLATLALRLSDLPGQERHLRRAVTLCESSGAADCRAVLAPDLGFNALLRGDLAAARPLLEAALKENASRDVFREVVTLSRLATLDAYEGDLEAALAKKRRGEAVANGAGDRVLADWQRADVALLEIEAGHAAQAAELAAPVAEMAAANGKGDLEAYARTIVGRARLSDGRVDAASPELVRARALLPMMTDPMDRMLLDVTEGRFLSATGKSGEAVERLRAAVASAEAAGFVGQKLAARAELAAALVAARRTADARTEIAALEKEAAARGYGLFVRKAAALRKGSTFSIDKRG